MALPESSVPSQFSTTVLRSSKFWNFLKSISKIFEKIIKNVTSRKLKALEQSYLEAKIATPESSLTISNYRIESFKVLEFF